MKYRRLGISGMKISAISIGAWLTYGSDKVEEQMAIECIQTAVDLGVNFIDVADIYSKGAAEETVGKAIADMDRTKLVISTKAYWPMTDDPNDRGLSRKHIVESVEKSLKRLGTDYVDIFFCHRYDVDTTTEETVRAIDDLIRQGKILYWGTSMWDAHQINEAVAVADKYGTYKPVTEQPLYNMLDREVVEGDLEDCVSDHGMGLVCWSPLAGGLLTGKYNDGIPEGSRAATQDSDWASDKFADYRIEKARAISRLAQELGVTSVQLALAWVLEHPNVDSAITGATKPEHVKANVEAVNFNITPEIEQTIENVLQNRPFLSSREATNEDEVAAI